MSSSTFFTSAGREFHFSRFITTANVTTGRLAMVAYGVYAANLKSWRISSEETIPLTTPFWIASGVSDWGIATGTPPRRLTTSALVPATRSSNPLRSASDFTGVFVMKLVGGQVEIGRML